MFPDREAVADTRAKSLALSCLEAGIRAGHPSRVTASQVTLEDERLRVCDTSYDLSAYERILVVGGGKAAGEQAAALESVLGDRIDDGLVITVDSIQCQTIDVRIGDHPIPGQRSRRSTEDLLDLLKTVDDDTLVLVVISGGGSALLAAPAVPLDAYRELTEDLLRAGATIDEINVVRRQCSTIKGGGLAAAAAPADIVAMVMSDVVGDPLPSIASGPTVPDPSTPADALAVLDRYGIDAPTPIVKWLTDRPAESTATSFSQSTDRIVETHLIADSGTAMRAAAEHASEEGYAPLRLSSRIRGESREAAKSFVAIGEEAFATGDPIAAPAVIVSAGETTVTVSGHGQGGPNQEFALSAGIELQDPVTVAAIDTDGIDGTGPAAGGIVDHETIDDRDAALAQLDANDVYPLLDEAGAALEPGPTGTNLNDLRVAVIPSSD